MSGIRGVLARGGSSRGLIVDTADIAGISRERLPAVLARLVGSPDPSGRQIDGVGGGNATTSKVAAVQRSDRPGCDLDYSFFQVDVATGDLECRGTCGNLTAAVGQFAVHEGLVEAVEPITSVRLYDTNTRREITVEVPVVDGAVAYEGDVVHSGVPGTGAPVTVRFERPGGAVSGALLPTGQPWDMVPVGSTEVPVTLIDAVNPVALVDGRAMDADGMDVEVLERDRASMDLLEAVRRWAAVQAGLARSIETAVADSGFLPFVGFVLSPRPYRTIGGSFLEAGDMDVFVRLLSGGAVHRAVPLGAGLATAVAARIPKSVACFDDDPSGERLVRLGHPSGTLETSVTTSEGESGPVVESVAVTLTGRRIMEGTVYL